ncbi:hypothetical protein ACE02G_10300 [Shewanella xiamenensis]|nr:MULTISPECIES: hypothetical protein [Shewanella]PZP37163.1 MAG: hypothetical protein DI594_04075 [Shewanella oneidensis]MCT8863719.1 hypothetical protein [Shewanella xiamenensis]MCT8872743.1 hypothetical protein [Shewanella xiamenensis]MCT8876629.1 hypothetical protein [Shewanella xiamenensis]NSM23174.1 hypothetical protein [Shewanella sp. ZOR0012]
MWYSEMAKIISAALGALMCGCAATKPTELELNFSYQDNYDYFGYITNWVKNLDIPPTPENTDGAEKDFSLCKNDTKERLIDNKIPSREVQLAFIVECMSKKGWFLSVDTYMVTR